MDDLTTQRRTTVVIWCAMVVSLLLYAFIGEVLAAVNAPFRGFVPDMPLDLPRWVFVGITVAQFAVLGFVVRSVLDGRAAGAQRAPAVQRLQTAAIIRFAVCEAAGVYGFVLFLLGGERRDLYAFIAVALIALAVNFPRLERWREWARGQAHRPG